MFLIAPGTGYTTTNPPAVVIDKPLSYTNIPIIYDPNSTTGAGSVLSSDLPADSLGVTRTKEKHIKNWKRRPKK